MPPYFSADYPLASKYGGLGYQIAHELAHSFGSTFSILSISCLDKFGIQFSGTGSLQALLSGKPLTDFNKMTDCLTKQYKDICPLTRGDYQPNCVDEVRTLNENIADNAGGSFRRCYFI
jgi:predicted metalloendopeptidase